MILLALAVLAATPATAPAVIAAAKCGDTVRLAAGDYGRFVVNRRECKPRITIRAEKARFQYVAITRVKGLTMYGGTVTPDATITVPGYGVQVQMSSGVSLLDPVVTGGLRAIAVDRSSGVLIRRATMRGQVVDGINIALSQKVTVQNSTCADFAPRPADHPDCIQMWSRPGGITSDVLLEGNSATGAMQGFAGFNHITNGVDDGGFDRVTIRNNRVLTSFPQGIALYDCRKCSISGNTVETLPGARWKTTINAIGGTTTLIGNSIAAMPK